MVRGQKSEVRGRKSTIRVDPCSSVVGFGRWKGRGGPKTVKIGIFGALEGLRSQFSTANGGSAGKFCRKTGDERAFIVFSCVFPVFLLGLGIGWLLGRGGLGQPALPEGKGKTNFEFRMLKFE